MSTNKRNPECLKSNDSGQLKRPKISKHSDSNIDQNISQRKDYTPVSNSDDSNSTSVKAVEKLDEFDDKVSVTQVVEVETKSKEDIVKARLLRQDQKRQTVERKQNKTMGDTIQRSKRIWEHLRKRTVSAEQRQYLIKELQSLLTGRIKDLVFKHDASRIVQTALKYGSKSVRAGIAAELKGSYVDLAQSSYGKYLVVKVMHYGTPETRKAVVEEFCGNLKKLIKHREASFVLDDCFREFASQEQRARLLREFYGLEFAAFATDTDPDSSLANILNKRPEKRAVIMKYLFDMLVAIVQKGAIIFSIVHRAMLEFVSNITPATDEANEFIDLIKEHVGDIAFTKDGAEVVMRCLVLGTSKDRKIILKSFKSQISSMAMHEAAHLVLVTAYDVLDDTVLTSKTFISELQQNIPNLAAHKYGRIALLYPFIGRKTRLLQQSAITLLEEIDSIRKITSKKDPEIRIAELRNLLSPVMIQGVIDHIDTLVHDSFGCQFITDTLLGANGDKSNAIEAISKLSALGNPNDDKHFASSAAGGRMLKTLVTGGYYNGAGRKVEVIEPPLDFHTALYKAIGPCIQEWATGSRSFVVVGLLEAFGFQEKQNLIGDLRQNLSAVKAAAESGNKGSRLIIEKLQPDAHIRQSQSPRRIDTSTHE